MTIHTTVKSPITLCMAIFVYCLTAMACETEQQSKITHNIQFTAEEKEYTFQGTAYYDTLNEQTRIRAENANSYISMNIDGDEEDSYNHERAEIFIGIDSGEYTGHDFNLTITSYGDIGQNIKGTLVGVFIDDSTPTSILPVSGSFSIERDVDR